MTEKPKIDNIRDLIEYDEMLIDRLDFESEEGKQDITYLLESISRLTIEGKFTTNKEKKIGQTFARYWESILYGFHKISTSTIRPTYRNLTARGL